MNGAYNVWVSHFHWPRPSISSMHHIRTQRMHLAHAPPDTPAPKQGNHALTWGNHLACIPRDQKTARNQLST